ncbi:hypothetical protein SAMN05421734_10120 [Pelagirhabdus alkalitolerans]|uniref:Uncharacterized protein n=1 Tax=Pelagirhabdus alkalitolerans TaxID=1612202 RepID=A0A1G6GGG6_9BACI|nr:hypothetical protein [Pelagirhabdus alkalitolerans]SDB80923.1 hypothetical protein SAMN05421734_10120 [Pelagirhabdus alkalitolerans]
MLFKWMTLLSVSFVLLGCQSTNLETATASQSKQTTLEEKARPLTEQFFVEHILEIEQETVDMMYEHYEFHDDGFTFTIEFNAIKNQLTDFYTVDQIETYIKGIYDQPNDYNEYLYAFPLGASVDIYDAHLMHHTNRVELIVESDFYYQPNPTIYELVLEDGKWKINGQRNITLPADIRFALTEDLANHGYEEIDSIDVTEDLDSFEDRLPYYKGEKDYPFEVQLSNQNKTLTGEFDPLTGRLSQLEE